MKSSVVVFTGAGDRVFCGGRDIHDLQVERSEPGSANVGDPAYLGREAFFAVRHCAVPVICAVNGAAVGAGVALAAVSDIVLAVESATFALAEIDVGVLEVRDTPRSTTSALSRSSASWPSSCIIV